MIDSLVNILIIIVIVCAAVWLVQAIAGRR